MVFPVPQNWGILPGKDTDVLSNFAKKCNKFHKTGSVKQFLSMLRTVHICVIDGSRVKPDLKTTSIKRPPVLRDHIQILPRVITIILICIKRPPVFKRPLFVIKRPLFPSDLHFMSDKTYFNLLDRNFKFEMMKLREINCCNGLFNLFAFHFQNSSVFMKKQWTYCTVYRNIPVATRAWKSETLFLHVYPLHQP